MAPALLGHAGTMENQQCTIEASPSARTAAPRRVAAAGPSYAPGQTIAGKYQLIRTLDQGGMGVVWVAHHLGLDVHVALKLVLPEVDSPEAAERLVVEAQAAARLRHPAIVQTLDVGRTDEGDPFLVMELLEGECLADVLARERRLDAITALRVILPVADALEAMHAKGILHRDIKADNVFLSHDDAGRWQPKLIDFGLARMATRSRVGRITERGAIIGTPVYLSPERLRGEDASAQDDVWALCVLLYVLVTGALPFEGDTLFDVLVALRRDEPSPLTSHGVEDPALWAILRRGLAPRGTRWPSVRALRESLTAELLTRGATQDIAGLALGAAARPEQAAAAAREEPGTPSGERRRPEWQVRTGLLVRPPTVETPPLRSQPPLARGPEPRARIAPTVLLALAVLSVVLAFVAGLVVGRR